jgi:DNA-directed RNA polymerase subunit omega
MQEEGGERLSSYVSEKYVGKALEEVAAGALTKEVQDEATIYEDEI